MSSRVFPTGVVRYIPEKCWNGFTLIPSVDSLSTARGAALFDMNGNLVHTWEGVYGAFDNKLLPNGDILGTSGYMKGYWLDCVDIVQKDWNGNTVWSFNNGEEVLDLDTHQKVLSARQHHDFQREGCACGYYVPGMEPRLRGRMLINSSVNRVLPEFSRLPVTDSRLMVIDEEGNCLWEGYYDAGDERFHPDNIISDIRILNTSFIIDHRTGDIVWRMGPDFESDKKLQDIGQIVGQHHVHMIQKGLPGEGNILLFDNGGQAGLGKPTPCAPTGYCNATRGYSRVLEINPVTMERVWSYNDPSEFEGNIEALSQMNQLFSHYCSSADRLPNGNTLITEMLHGRVIEVTPEREVVWEFINPGGKVFRAHRYPYAWCQQAEHHEEQTVLPVKNSRIRLNVHGEPVLIDENPFFG